MRTKRFHGTIIAKPQYTGLSIEQTIRQAIATNQPLEAKAPLIFTPAADGVVPAYNVRTDRQDLALQANDKFQGSEAMKGFIQQVELDEKGSDGKNNVKQEKTE